MGPAREVIRTEIKAAAVAIRHTAVVTVLEIVDVTLQLAEPHVMAPVQVHFDDRHVQGRPFDWLSGVVVEVDLHVAEDVQQVVLQAVGLHSLRVVVFLGVASVWGQGCWSVSVVAGSRGSWCILETTQLNILK